MAGGSLASKSSLRDLLSCKCVVSLKVATEDVRTHLLHRADTEANTPKRPPNRIIFSLLANCSVRAMTMREMPERR